jgi:hypothetical protein
LILETASAFGKPNPSAKQLHGLEVEDMVEWDAAPAGEEHEEYWARPCPFPRYQRHRLSAASYFMNSYQQLEKL